MRTALELDTKTAQRLRQLAEEQKLSVEQLLIVYVPGLGSEEVTKNGSEAADPVQAFDEWVASFPGDTPPLSDEAVSRSSIYRDR